MGNKNSITGVYKSVGKGIETIKVNNSLKDLQGLVEGNIEVVSLPMGVVMLLNEDGKIFELSLNFGLYSSEKPYPEIIDNIHGNVLFLSTISDHFISLDKIQMNYIKKCFDNPLRDMHLIPIENK